MGSDLKCADEQNFYRQARERDFYRTDQRGGLIFESILVEHDGGQGRNNFVGACDVPEVILSSSLEMFDDSYHEDSIWLPVPYPAIPPKNYFPREPGDYKAFTPFTKEQHTILNRYLWGLWTLPPDDRLDLEFQSHILRRHAVDGNLEEHIKGIRSSLDRLRETGGSFEIIEIDDTGNRYTYQPFESATASDVEEWFLKIAPKLVKVNCLGFPVEPSEFTYHTESRLANQWKRVV